MKETPRATAFCDKAILAPTEPLIVVDAKHDPRFADNPLVTGKPNIRFYAGVPLVTKSDQQPIGTLCVIGTQSRELSDEQLETLTVLANHAEKLLHLREATIELLSQQRELQQQQELTRLGRLSLAGELVAEVSHEIKPATLCDHGSFGEAGCDERASRVGVWSDFCSGRQAAGSLR